MPLRGEEEYTVVPTERSSTTTPGDQLLPPPVQACVACGAYEPALSPQPSVPLGAAMGVAPRSRLAHDFYRAGVTRQMARESLPTASPPLV
ncbi:hypothetical protein MTO96_000260 [Rhipicephalus appendiculatus]